MIPALLAKAPAFLGAGRSEGGDPHTVLALARHSRPLLLKPATRSAEEQVTARYPPVLRTLCGAA
jgi:hypothetical protein